MTEMQSPDFSALNRLASMIAPLIIPLALAFLSAVLNGQTGWRHWFGHLCLLGLSYDAWLVGVVRNAEVTLVLGLVHVACYVGCALWQKKEDYLSWWYGLLAATVSLSLVAAMHYYLWGVGTWK